MIKKISKPVASIVKSSALVSAIAFGVVSLQTNADVNLPLSSIATSANSASSSGHHWSPSVGFADLIERVSPAVVHVGTSVFVLKQSH